MLLAAAGGFFERSGSGCCRLYSDVYCSLPAPLGQEDQGDPAPVPLGPLDSLTPFPRRGHPGPHLGDRGCI